MNTPDAPLSRSTIRRLRGRARHLRRESNLQPSPLALAYRRRAAELELQAEVLDEKLIRVAPSERAETLDALVTAA